MLIKEDPALVVDYIHWLQSTSNKIIAFCHVISYLIWLWIGCWSNSIRSLCARNISVFPESCAISTASHSQSVCLSEINSKKKEKNQQIEKPVRPVLVMQFSPVASSQIRSVWMHYLWWGVLQITNMSIHSPSAYHLTKLPTKYFIIIANVQLQTLCTYCLFGSCLWLFTALSMLEMCSPFI